jgi:hypothetical protein
MSTEPAPAAGNVPVEPDNIHADSTAEAPAEGLLGDGKHVAKPTNIHADGTKLGGGSTAKPDNIHADGAPKI